LFDPEIASAAEAAKREAASTLAERRGVCEALRACESAAHAHLLIIGVSLYQACIPPCGCRRPKALSVLKGTEANLSPGNSTKNKMKRLKSLVRDLAKLFSDLELLALKLFLLCHMLKACWTILFR
jgi:hypothetical protein